MRELEQWEWNLIRFDAEHDDERMFHERELQLAEEHRRSLERKQRAVLMPPPDAGTLLLDEALGRLEGVRRSGRGWIAKCPAHEDGTASLSIIESEARPGEPVFHCHAGCDWRLIRDHLAGRYWGEQ